VETALKNSIILTVDYHDENSVIRRLDLRSGTEQLLRVPTCPKHFQEIVDQARTQARRQRGQVVWLQESTTGWARVQTLLADRDRLQFLLANVVQLPRLPKGHRRKTDTLDTARLQREYLNGQLPLAHQPPAWWRQLRRLVALRENLVSRRTALRNWINRYLAHETWENRANLWSPPGQLRLRALVPGLPGWDGPVLAQKLDELDRLATQVSWVEVQLHAIYRDNADAQRLDAVRGIGVVAAVSILARIGPIERFRDADQLIAYAGLAPGVRQSDQTRRDGRIGGGGTDRHLRHYLIEASVWARQLERYRPTYERVAARRGKKIGRLVVARLLLRSIYKVLRDGVAFVAEPRAAATAATPD
jgi:transposase